jgi:hypothetical protein
VKNFSFSDSFDLSRHLSSVANSFQNFPADLQKNSAPFRSFFSGPSDFLAASFVFCGRNFGPLATLHLSWGVVLHHLEITAGKNFDGQYNLIYTILSFFAS